METLSGTAYAVPAPPRGELANAVSLRGFVSHSAALSQKAALQMLLSVTTPPVKRQFWKIRRFSRIAKL